MQVDWLWGQFMVGVYVYRGQVHVCAGPLSLHWRRNKPKRGQAATSLTPAKEDKAGRNDLSQWEAYGGTLKRPPPPMPYKPKKESSDG
jgi:hypothetical protein